MKILFLHHQQRLNYKLEPTYVELFKPFALSGFVDEYDEFIYQSELRKYSDRVFVDMHKAMGEKLLQKVEASQPDLIVYSLTWWGECIRPTYFFEIKKRWPHIKILTHYWDHNENNEIMMNYERDCHRFSDLVVIPDSHSRAERLRRREGVYADFPFPEKAHFVPTVFDPDHYKKLDVPKEFDVAIFGSAEGLREGYIFALQQRYGARFHHFGGFHAAEHSYIGVTDYVSKINATKIFVNTQTFPQNRIQLKGKVREALSCGTFLLEGENTESRHYLKDTPTVFFSEIQDLYQKVDYYLEHEDEREATAQISHDWYLENHSPQKWARYLLESMNLPLARG